MSARLLPVGVFVYLFRETLEADPLYSDLWLEGEITDISRSSAGHTYFSLRDADGALKCVLFRGQALRQLQAPRLGDQVAVHGGLSIYPRSGAMQLVVDLLRPAGLGVASLELEYLRQQLEAEGLFDPLRKRPLPPWPKTIGVVTSPHGAAWHDIQHVIGRRFPLATLVLSPAQVQGYGAAESVVEALQNIQSDPRVDVVILARGGGASDDLSAFNEEAVVRAVFGCRVPVIAGIGHATDRTLVEDAADVSAPTPSAAAELCVPSAEELTGRISELSSRLIWALATRHDQASASLGAAGVRLRAASPRERISDGHVAAHLATTALKRAVSLSLERSTTRTTTAAGLLASLDPSAVLRRGYAAIHDPERNEAIFSVHQLRTGQRTAFVLADGAAESTIDVVHPRRRETAVT